MAVQEILLLGNPQLYRVSEPFMEDELALAEKVVADLHDTLMDFRARHGVGRAIASPQIGVVKRLLYMYIHEPVVFINPVLENRSKETMEIWDDCMSFPDLLVKVRRHKSCTIRYRDMAWKDCSMPMEEDLSELLQHEYDHLEGILAVSRAVDERSFALRSQRSRLEPL